MKARILHANSFRLLAKYTRPVADVLLTDPPYSEMVHKTMAKKGTLTNGKLGKVPLSFEPLKNLDFVKPWMSLVRRWSLYFCAIEQLGDYRRSSLDHFVRSGIYIKGRAMPQITGDRPGNRCEGIAIFHARGKKRWNGGGSAACWVANPPNRKDTGHPTAKPIFLAMQLVDLFSDPGETILDPFAGSGTFGMAALAMGRNYVGIEIDDNYVQLCHQRIEGMNAKHLVSEYRAWLLKNRVPIVQSMESADLLQTSAP